MIRRNNRELDRIAEEVALWSAEETKLRLLNSLDAEEEEFLLAAAAPSARVAKVPSTWYLLRKQKVDEKLRRYLKNSVQKLGIKLDAALNRHNSIPAKAQFHPSQQTLKRIADKISMTPGLSSGGSGFRQKRQGYGELLAAVRRSVTAIQLIDGFLSRLISENVTEKEQSDLLGGLESTLETLENEINQRKNIYGV